LRPTARRDPPPMSALLGLQKQNSRSSVEQEDSCGCARSNWNP
jgi:hypothetical protein